MVDQPEPDRDSETTANDGFRLAPNAAPGKLISAAAKRALLEAQARREAQAKADNHASDAPEEIAGPKGAEPTRYGDWERGGIAYDF